MSLHRISPKGSVLRLAPLATPSRGTKAMGARIHAGFRLRTEPQKEFAMSPCPKCAGLLVSAPSPLSMLTNYVIDTSDLKVGSGPTVRCVNCGYFSDPVMLANRAKQVQEQQLIEQANVIATWAALRTNPQAA